jgi:lipid II:glycine glycyltransferase (peptidoglycan interpeptide bridge formation enzyme)
MKLNNFVHVIQSKEWGAFKTEMKTSSVTVGDLQFTKHAIPKLPYFIAYAPKVNFLKQKFDWEELKTAAKKEKCIMVRFDVPNNIETIYKDDGTELKNDQISEILNELNQKCVISPRSTFSPHNVMLDISGPQDEIFANLSQKTRYNIRLAEKKGVIVRVENNEKGIAIFNKLMKETASRQKFLAHSSEYYQKCFETLSKNNMANILVAYYETEPLVAWMVFNKDNVLYYPYGTSSNEYRNLMPSNLVAWEVIKLGKSLGCDTFDMWGATNDENSKWWGFTKFKLGYGGKLVKYIDSYDLVVNAPVYQAFNMAYALFWKLKSLLYR